MKAVRFDFDHMCRQEIEVVYGPALRQSDQRWSIEKCSNRWVCALWTLFVISPLLSQLAAPYGTVAWRNAEYLRTPLYSIGLQQIFTYGVRQKIGTILYALAMSNINWFSKLVRSKKN